MVTRLGIRLYSRASPRISSPIRRRISRTIHRSAYLTCRHTPPDSPPPPDVVEGRARQSASMGKTRNKPLSPSAQAMVNLQQMMGLLPATTTETTDAADAPPQDVVFVCIDVEAFELSNDIVTELGVSVLDTRTLHGDEEALCEPNNDDDASVTTARLLAKLQHAHYRLVEGAQLVNHRFVHGCPQAFHFGTTTWITRADARRVLARIFHDPTRLAQAADFSRESQSQQQQEQQQQQQQAPARKVVLVGHDLKADAAHLRNLGFDLSTAAEAEAIVGRVDTQRLVSSKARPVGLQRLLLALGVAAVADLHNAGNDAAYTLQALVRMAVAERGAAGSVRERVDAFGWHKLGPAPSTGVRAPEVWAGSAVRPVVLEDGHADLTEMSSSVPAGS